MKQNDDKELWRDLTIAFKLPAIEGYSKEDVRLLLAAHINQLIVHEFDRLISLLYRMDVSESKLKQLIEKNSDADAGLIIADLVIERQEQKIKSRQQFRQRDNDIPEEDKW